MEFTSSSRMLPARLWSEIITDRSAASLVLANLLTVVLALWQGWDLAPLMWVYWFQSVVIGIFNFVRILCLGRFSTKGVKINDRPVDPTRSTKFQTAFFFLFHYGFFHFVYMVFLGVERPLEGAETGLVFVCVAAFLLNHAYSFIHNRESDRRKVRNIGTLMMFPYARIIPMHLTIIFGGMMAGGVATLLLFLGLKTAADVVMHAVEHHMKSAS
jgi:hypothetical protein